MGAAASLVLHSKAPCGYELVTMQATYERYIHDELLTHRRLSRNSRSSRAVPVDRMIAEVEANPTLPMSQNIEVDVLERMIRGVYEDPVSPPHWGANQRGMQAREEISPEDQRKAEEAWLEGRDNAVKTARKLLDLGVHKQVVNYVLMPYTWITVVISSTYWTNLFALRCHPDAHPAFQRIAGLMYQVWCSSVPEELKAGQWHLPYTSREERGRYEMETLFGMSVSRCARISIKPFNAERASIPDDLRLYADLQRGAGDGIGHMSPFEHVGQASDLPIQSGNFVGFLQHRKQFTNEEIRHIPHAVRQKYGEPNRTLVAAVPK